MNATNRKPQCCSQVIGRNFCQESYETSTGDAKIRAKELRAAGFLVTVGSLGSQVTPLGSIRLTMVNVQPKPHSWFDDLPTVEKVYWPR